MPSRKTRAEIVTAGLERGAQPAIILDANRALNRFLEQLYRSYDWPFLLLDVAFTTNANGDIDLATLVPEFLSIKDLFVITDRIGRLEQEPRYEELWAEVEQQKLEGFTGPVNRWAFDPQVTRIRFTPPPNKALTGRLLYFQLPADLDESVGGPDDDKFPDWPDAEGLIAFVEAFAHRWRRDNIFTIAEAMKQQAINRVKATIQQRGRTTPLQVKWGRGFPRKPGN